MSLLEQMYRWLQRRRKLLALGTILLAFLLSLSLQIGQVEASPQSVDSIDVYFEIKYSCGVETQVLTFEDMNTFHEWLRQDDAEWEVTSIKENQFLAQREDIKEITDICKEEGYFGLSEDGMLVLYQGPPVEDHVIETFFRIDTQRIQTALPQGEWEALQEGIRIRNMAEYCSVLSTYSEFNIEEA